MNDTTDDPTWIPSRTVRENDIDNSETELDSTTRYNLRSTNSRNPEIEVIPEQPEVESDEQIDTSQNETTVEGQSFDSNQGPSYPYSLRKLPGRRNYDN